SGPDSASRTPRLPAKWSCRARRSQSEARCLTRRRPRCSDARSPRSRAPLLAALQPIGVGLVIVSIVPAALWVAVLVGRARTRTVRRSARQVRHEEQETLESLHAMDLGSEAGRRDAYDRVNALVR